jgi:hypothetical protein
VPIGAAAAVVRVNVDVLSEKRIAANEDILFLPK